MEKPRGVLQCSSPSWVSLIISALRWLNEVLLSFPNNSYTIQETHIVSKKSVFCLKYRGAIFTTETTRKTRVTLPYREALLLGGHLDTRVSLHKLAHFMWVRIRPFPTGPISLIYLSPHRSGTSGPTCFPPITPC